MSKPKKKPVKKKTAPRGKMASAATAEPRTIVGITNYTCACGLAFCAEPAMGIPVPRPLVPPHIFHLCHGHLAAWLAGVDLRRLETAHAELAKEAPLALAAGGAR